MLATLTFAVAILLPAAAAVVLPDGLAARSAGAVTVFPKYCDPGARTRRIARAQAAQPRDARTFSTSSGLSVGLLIAVIIVVGALTFLPADALGPIVEPLQMRAGKML